MNDKENIFENTDEVKIIVRFNKQLIITRKNNISCGYMYDYGWRISWGSGWKRKWEEGMSELEGWRWEK